MNFDLINIFKYLQIYQWISCNIVAQKSKNKIIVFIFLHITNVIHTILQNKLVKKNTN